MMTKMLSYKKIETCIFFAILKVVNTDVFCAVMKMFNKKVFTYVSTLENRRISHDEKENITGFLVSYFL